jgi:hypothetical protein
VALHAYGTSSGPMIVEIDATDVGVSVRVVDHGTGITRISGGEDRMGLGLAVISALADSSEFRHPEGGGTEVRMWFRRTRAEGITDFSGASDHSLERHTPPPLPAGPRGEDEILLYLAPVAVMRFVFGRMVQSLAAASHFSVAKLSDLRAANAAIAGYIEEAADGDGAVSLSLSSSTRRLVMTTGPLPAHDPEGARAALSEVVDGLTTERENITIELLDRTRDPIL